MKYLFPLFIISILYSCQNQPSVSWKWEQTIQLDSIRPNGILVNDDGIMVADPSHNSLVQLTTNGDFVKSIQGFQRPMHIDSYQDQIYVSDFLSDSIKTWNGEQIGHAKIDEQPDAPSGVSVTADGTIAVADFYNNRIIYTKNGTNLTFGKEGMDAGDLNYPTDVQFAHNRIYVADAYNHRINVYDMDGQFQFSFGEAEKMNAAVGIHVSDQHVFVCDYENSKLNIYSIDGKFQTSVSDDLLKPTDSYFYNNKLYVTNFEGKSIVVFSTNE